MSTTINKSQLEGLVGSAQLSQQIANAGTMIQNLPKIQIGNNKVPIVPIALVIVCVGFVLFQALKSKSNSSRFSVTYDSLKANSKNAIWGFIQFQNEFNFMFINNHAQCSVSHLIINGYQVGIVITNNTTTSPEQKYIYLTYYEFLNWFANGGVLSIPKRTVANDVVTESETESYTFTFDQSTLSYKIDSLMQKSEPRVDYVGSSGTVSIATNTEPDVSLTSEGDGVLEFVPQSSLDPISLATVTALQSNLSGSITFTYNQTNLTPSVLQINNTPVGFQLTSSDQSVKLYLTYKELLNLTKPGVTLTLPSRAYATTAIIDDMTHGYSFVSNMNVVQITAISAPVTYQSLVTANIVDVLNVGADYPFYIVNDLLAPSEEIIINTFLQKQSMIKYTFAGASATGVIDHALIGNTKVGLKLSIGGAEIYLSYREVFYWLTNDFRSPGANASLVVAARAVEVVPGPHPMEVVRPITTQGSGSYKLAFNPIDNALIDVTFSTNQVVDSVVNYNNTTTTPPILVTVNANTGA